MAIGFLATACGDDDGEVAADATTTTSESTTSTTAASTTTEAPEETDAPEGAGADISIASSEFDVSGPVAAGQPVSINNTDSFEHTVTSDEEGVFDVPLDGGESAEITADLAPGSYDFHCEVHPFMQSTLVVE